jgi:hypothetical protein
MANYNAIMARANQVASTPYSQYGGQMVAGFTPDQYSAFNTVNNAQGIAQPYFDAARNYGTMGAAPITGQQIQSYENPYQQQVINATLGNLNLLNSQQQANLTSGVAGSGGLFNDRYGVAQGQLAGQQATTEAPTLAQLSASNYTQALSAAQADRSAYQNAAYTFGNLGNANLQAILSGANAELSSGGLQQQLAQQYLTVPYQQFLQQQAFPYQQTGWLAGIDTGVGSNMGGTSTTTATPAAPNPWSTVAGIGMGIGAFLNRGGGINRPRHYDSGGGVPTMPYSGNSPMYGGVTSYVPTAQIVHGSGPPKAPSAPSTSSTTNPLQLGESIGKAFGKIEPKVASYLGNLDPSIGDAQQAGLASGMSADEVGLGIEGAFRKGGGIHLPRRHYDEGGSVPFPGAYNPTELPPVQGFGGDAPAAPAPLLDLGQPIQLPPSMATMASAPADASGFTRPSWAGAVSAPGLSSNAAEVTPSASRAWPGETPPSAAVAPPAREPSAQQEAPVYTGGDRKNALSYGAGVVSMDRAKNAIGTFESGNDYSSVGPPTKLGRALGRYQVMEKELSGQLKQAGLPSMTSQEFLRDPKAQDKLFETVFGGIMEKRGNFNDAASIWFSGRPVAEAGGRKDVLGTTVPMYLANTNAILAKDVGDTVSPSARAPRTGTATLGDTKMIAPGADTAVTGSDERSKRSGLFGLNMSPETRTAMLKAGFTMLASGSPYLGVAAGQAGLAGMGSYQESKRYADTQAAATRKEALNERMINARIGQLDQAAKTAASRLDVYTKWQGETERHNQENERRLVDVEHRRLDQEARLANKPPPNYQWADEGRTKVKPIEGGPADPTVIAATSGAKRPPVQGISPEMQEVNARQIVAGNLSPLVGLPRTPEGLQIRNAYRQRAVQILMEERGMNPEQAAAELNEKEQGFKARQIGINSQARTAGVREENLNLILRAADAAIPAALEASEKVKRLPFTPLSRIIQHGEMMVSDPDLVEFGMANLQLAEHWARAMNPTGVMRESDRDKAMSFLDTNLTKGTYERAVMQLKKQITRERDAIRGVPASTPLNLAAPTPEPGAGAGTEEHPAAAATPHEGDRKQFKQGWGVFRGGQWAPEARP